MNGLPKWALSACLLLFYALLLSPAVQADARTDKHKVEREIKKLGTRIGKQKKESAYLNTLITQLEKELGELAAQQHRTEQKITAVEKRLRKTDIEKTELGDQLKQQQTALAQQLQAMHTAGEQSHLRLLLLQDKPADMSRHIQYFNILNRYRTQKINEFNKTRQKLEAVTQQAAKERTELFGLNEKLAVQKRDVKKKLATREQALQKVNSDLNNDEKRFNKLKQQEAALQQTIDRITQASRQKQQTAARREAAKHPAEQRTQPQVPQRVQPNPQAPSVTKQRQPDGKKVAITRTPNRAFSKMRGKLSWPVNGRVIHNYGSQRNEKQRWEGIVIAAPGGEKVTAIAPGTVVFANWMDGYGHLIMIEHDRNYLSLYGYNRAVFKQSGQRVRAGETIAAIGNSSGQHQNALYFGIRHNSVPQNPAHWLRK